MPELRQRPVKDSYAEEIEEDVEIDHSVSESEETEEDEEDINAQIAKEDGDDRWITPLDILRVLFALSLFVGAFSYFVTSESFTFDYRPWFTNVPAVLSYLKGPVQLTPSQLALYNGTDPDLPIYVAVNGSVFDVSSNRPTYGPGGSYSFFAGRDATRAYVTGCFQEDLTPDIRGVEEMFLPVEGGDGDEEFELLSEAEKEAKREEEMRNAVAKVKKQVNHWEGFFRKHKDYLEVGKVVGVEDEGEKRELCAAAKKQRPKRKKAKAKD
ncbi:hypothetical protein FQN54_001281 [Arachnomyces sp. PD_36]|nr:hypothetical protein FQN54_001281 [Arachnomyces sp. PD_36]